MTTIPPDRVEQQRVTFQAAFVGDPRPSFERWAVAGKYLGYKDVKTETAFFGWMLFHAALLQQQEGKPLAATLQELSELACSAADMDSLHMSTALNLISAELAEVMEAGRASQLAPPAGRDQELLSLHRKLAAETLRADQGWSRYEAANAARSRAEAELAESAGALPAGPVPTTHVECRECDSCGHVGLNDDDGARAACNSCGWTGDNPSEDKCPGCNREGTMSAACPKCGERYRLIASMDIPPSPAVAQKGGNDE